MLEPVSTAPAGSAARARTENASRMRFMFTLLLWEKKRRDEAQAPACGVMRPFRVIASAQREVHPLAAQIEQVSGCQIDRNRPLPGFPVVGAFGVEAEIGGVRPGVAE